MHFLSVLSWESKMAGWEIAFLALKLGDTKFASPTMPSEIPRTSLEPSGVHIGCVWKQGMTPPQHGNFHLTMMKLRGFWRFFPKGSCTKPLSNPIQPGTSNLKWYKVRPPSIAKLVYDNDNDNNGFIDIVCIDNMYLYIYIYIYVVFHMWFTCLLICSFIFWTYLSTSLSIYLLLYLSIHSCIDLFTYIFTYSFIDLSNHFISFYCMYIYGSW